MPDDIVIAAESLAKRYRLGRAPGHDTLRDALAGGARRLARLWRPRTDGAAADEFWALRDVSFEVRRGEVVGIIGRNGAGKSTLLKILSRITEPTAGRVSLRGRVASLLEVGTGFHPELSGRENIYLNGAILGMTRAEIQRKFDAIVAFAEVEKFLDTPVKHYSSGMYVRLAFAVAAHLEPEILIVDEVLAVGDMQFQQKCLEKMQDVSAREGRTVLIVSHNMESILRLCHRALLLAEGRIESAGDASTTVRHYVQSAAPAMREADLSATARPEWARGGLRLRSARWLDDGSPAWNVEFGGTMEFELAIEARQPLPRWNGFIALFSIAGVEVACTEIPHAATAGAGSSGICRLRCRLDDLRLTPAVYSVNLGLKSDRGMEDFVPQAVSVTVLPGARSIALNADAYRGFYVPAAEYRLG